MIDWVLRVFGYGEEVGIEGEFDSLVELRSSFGGIDILAQPYMQATLLRGLMMLK